MNYRQLSEEANRLWNSDTAAARRALEEGLAAAQKAGDEGWAAFFHANLAVLRGDAPQALALYHQALALEPRNSWFLAIFGTFLGKLGRNEEALACFDRALEVEPRNAADLSSKGVSLLRLGRKEEALACFNLALAVEPRNARALINKGSGLSNLGREEEALAYFDRALDIEPSNPYALAWKGDKLRNRGRLEEARDCLAAATKVLEEKPDPGLAGWVPFLLERVGRELEARRANLPPPPIEVVQREDILQKVIEHFRDRRPFFFDQIKTHKAQFNSLVQPTRTIATGTDDFFCVLRRWNSYTPLLPSATSPGLGGGYFLFAGGKGIVVDPGFNLISNFFREGFAIADIDAVIITHAHNDHTVDFESILTLLHELNNPDAGAKLTPPKTIDLFLNMGAYTKYANWLLRASNLGNIQTIQSGGSYEIAPGVKLHVKRARHDEIIDESYCVGLVFEVGEVLLGLTSDTGWEEDESIGTQYAEPPCDILVVHLGSLREEEFEYSGDSIGKYLYRNHLGLLGIAAMLQRAKPKLAIVSEFGQELDGLRRPIAKGIQEVMKIPCLPGDIGLRIRLKDRGVQCLVCQDYCDPQRIVIRTPRESDRLCYLCPEGVHTYEEGESALRMARERG